MILQNHMADPKKDVKKPEAKHPVFGDVESLIFWLLILLAFLSLLYSLLKGYLGVSDSNSGSYFGDKFHQFTTWLSHALVQSINTLTFLSIFAIVMLIMGAYYAKFRRKEIIDDLKYKDEQLSMQANVKFSGGVVMGQNSNGLATVQSAGTEQWRGIEKYMQSQNPSDWRLAILEADILLYDMLEQIGFEGDTIAEKLKSVDPASFNTLDDAWTAHKVRNNLAHQGASYELTYDEARRTISKFKNVFDEFYFI